MNQNVFEIYNLKSDSQSQRDIDADKIQELEDTVDILNEQIESLKLYIAYINEELKEMEKEVSYTNHELRILNELYATSLKSLLLCQ